MKCYIHSDDSISSPFCTLGDTEAVRFTNNFPAPRFNLEGFEPPICCNSMACTCGNDYNIVREATPQETNDFFNTLRILADQASYEAEHNL